MEAILSPCKAEVFAIRQWRFLQHAQHKPGASQVFAWHLFLHSSWSFAVGGGQAFSTLSPEVQPPKKTGVLRFLLLNPGDRTVPSPWRHFHTAQPFGGEQPRAHAPPQAHAPHSRKPQTYAFCPPHFQIPAPAGVGPLHTQNIACSGESSSLCNAIIKPTCPICHHLMQYWIPVDFWPRRYCKCLNPLPRKELRTLASL